MPKTTERYPNLEAVSKFLTATKYSWLELVKDNKNTVPTPYQQLGGSAPQTYFREKLTN